MNRIPLNKIYPVPHNSKTYDQETLERMKKRALASLKLAPYELRDLNVQLKDDKDVVLTALKEDPLAFRHASKRLRIDADVIAASCTDSRSTFRLLRLDGLFYSKKRSVKFDLELATNNMRRWFEERDTVFYQNTLSSLDLENIESKDKVNCLLPFLSWLPDDSLSLYVEDEGMKNTLGDELLRRQVKVIEKSADLPQKTKRHRKIL